jgi:hypothetical protein
MGLRRRISKLTRQAEGDAVLIRLRNGSVKVFDRMTVAKELFLTRVDLACGRPIRHSEVLEAVRQAKPESRAAFEAEHGSITPETYIVASPESGGWVDFLRLEEDGTVTKVHHPGNTEEAKRIRKEARRQPAAF